MPGKPLAVARGRTLRRCRRSETIAGMDAGAGTYALILESAGRKPVAVGQLGTLDLRAGFYVYVGSALGPGGLQARINRHFDPSRPIHWHIDCLKRVTRIVEVWYLADPIRREHSWAKALANLPSASIPMPGFGSSDCDCPAHLFAFPTAPKLATFARALARTRGAGKAGTLRRLLPGDYLSLPTGNRGAPTGTR